MRVLALAKFSGFVIWRIADINSDSWSTENPSLNSEHFIMHAGPRIRFSEAEHRHVKPYVPGNLLSGKTGLEPKKKPSQYANIP